VLKNQSRLKKLMHIQQFCEVGVPIFNLTAVISRLVIK